MKGCVVFYQDLLTVTSFTYNLSPHQTGYIARLAPSLASIDAYIGLLSTMVPELLGRNECQD